MSSVLPERLEAIRRQFCIPDRMLNVPMTKVLLKRPRVVAVIGELEPAGMPEHVGVGWEG